MPCLCNIKYSYQTVRKETSNASKDSSDIYSNCRYAVVKKIGYYDYFLCSFCSYISVLKPWYVCKTHTIMCSKTMENNELINFGPGTEHRT